MRIPEIAAELIQIAKDHDIPRLDELASMLKRRLPRRRAKPSSAKLTAELKAKIKAYRVEHPDASQMFIARVFNVNPGRVSETLRGKRK